MPIGQIILILCVFAAVFFLLWKFMDPGNLKTVLLAVVAVFLVVWLAIVTGIWDKIAGIHT